MGFVFVDLFLIFLVLEQTTLITANLPPEAFLKVPEIVSLHGYPSEIHTPLTRDGYYLETFRIRNERALQNGVKPLLLLHGMFSSPSGYVVNGPNDSLAFLLYDAGYDVWMNSFRGISYSLHHVNPQITQKEFWDFDISTGYVEDVATLIDYILNVTKQDSLYLVPHSMGNCATVMTLSSRPEYNAKVKGYVTLGPWITGLGMKGTVLLIVATFLPLSIISNLFGIYFIPPIGPGVPICRVLPIICHIGSFILQFNVSPNYDPSNIPVFASHYPEFSSTNASRQLTQIVFSKKLIQQDYGRAGNMKRYNTPSPPEYDLRKVTANTIILYGTLDNIGSPEGAKFLAKHLPNLKRIQPIRANHGDFLFAKNFKKLIFEPVIKALSEF